MPEANDHKKPRSERVGLTQGRADPYPVPYSGLLQGAGAASGDGTAHPSAPFSYLNKFVSSTLPLETPSPHM